jgi:PPP family 3-phenylpropionic acid transporter
MTVDRPALRLAAFYGAVFAVVGIFLPYWPVWLEARGLTATEIGLVLGASFWPRLATNLLIPYWADRLGHHRLLAVGLALATLLGLVLFALAQAFWLYLLAGLITGAAWAAILPIGEAISLQRARQGAIDYGRVRLWGSVTFILLAVSGGAWLEAADAAIIWTLAMATVAATLVACWTLPEAEPAPIAAAAVPLARLVRLPGLLRLALAAGLIQASHALLYGFGTIHWRAAGHGETAIGALWALSVIAEILLFWWGTRLLSRLPPWQLLALAGALAALRWTMTALWVALPVLAVAQSLHAASFAAAHLAAMHHLRDHMPAALQASAQGVYMALGLAPLFGMLSPLSGWLYGAAGGHAFLVMAALALLGAGLGLGLRRPALPPVRPERI